jgi:2-oxoisovalerate dehydrogenase E1 component
MVVRIPVGFGKKTGDPWHSVSGEAAFAHTIGWRIAYPSNTEDAVGLLRAALRGEDPTFFFEHRALLDTSQARMNYPGDDYQLPFGVARVHKAGNSATIVTWGAMVDRATQAAEGLDVEILDLRTIVPWDKQAVLDSVKKTNRALVLHEEAGRAAWGVRSPRRSRRKPSRSSMHRSNALLCLTFRSRITRR